MRFERLARGHVIAAVAALALLLVMAMDWYGSHAADLAHQIDKTTNTSGSQDGEVGRSLQQDANAVIARDEKNAWQEPRTIDRILLAFLLLSVALPLYAAAHRAAGRRAQPPLTPSAVAAIVAAFTALLVAYRIINEPGVDAVTTVKIGAPLGLILLGVIGIGSANAFQGEADWAEMRRAASTPTNQAPDLPSEPDGPEPGTDSSDAEPFA